MTGLSQDEVKDILEIGEKQELFAYLESQWVAWVFAEGYALRHGEGRILQMGAKGEGRRAYILPNGPLGLVRDLVHKNGGAHYNGLAADWNLFIGDKWVANGEDPIWLKIGEHWEKLHPLCRWGGRWGDANHISLEHNGVK